MKRCQYCWQHCLGGTFVALLFMRAFCSNIPGWPAVKDTHALQQSSIYSFDLLDYHITVFYKKKIKRSITIL